MPELPEVETVTCGIAPLITDQIISGLILRVPRLRLPLDQHWCRQLPGQRITLVERRAKYVLIHTDRGGLIIHLGMTGVLRIVEAKTTPEKHDHVDLIFAGGTCLRMTDPRRFGCFLCTSQPPTEHSLLAGLGPEPFADTFSGEYLYRQSRRRKTAVKPFIMDQRIVVGVGNIYANEALYRAGIHPARPAGQIALRRYVLLAEVTQEVLTEAIAAGGTTISDFRTSEGRPGYFSQQLQVYDRAGQPCSGCDTALVHKRLGQRSTYFCPRCQR